MSSIWSAKLLEGPVCMSLYGCSHSTRSPQGSRVLKSSRFQKMTAGCSTTARPSGKQDSFWTITDFFLCKAFRDRPLIQKSSSEPFGFGYYFTTLIPPSMEIPSVKNRTDITQPRGSYSCARLKISETILEPKSYALSF